MKQATILFCTVLLVARFALGATAAGEVHQRGWLGLGVTYPDARPGNARFVFVQHVISGSPAAQAGLLPHDLITRIDGHAVLFSDREAMLRFFSDIHLGQTLRLSVMRANKTFNLLVTAIEVPPQYLALVRRSDPVRAKPPQAGSPTKW